MQGLPARVSVVEVGPRDGFQIERRWIPTEEKVHLVDMLSDTGLRTIQVSAFVHPEAVPQLADADEVFRHIRRQPGVTYEALVFNLRGAERARAAGAGRLELVVSATDSHSLANANRTTEEALRRLEDVAAAARAWGLPCGGGIATALGCPFEGFPPFERLLAIAERYRAMGVTEISIADTAGMANPVLVYDRLSRLGEHLPDCVFRLHLHDTRRMAAANVLAALEAGVTCFDGAVGGLGGCPFIPGASGNIATEDMVHMLHEMGIDTGIDLDAVLAVARSVVPLVDHTLESRLLAAGKSRDILGPQAPRG